MEAEFKESVKRLVETHTAIRALNKQSKALREQLSQLKKTVMRVMQAQSIDSCQVTHNGHAGELVMKSRTLRKGLKREIAIQQIERKINSIVGQEGSSNYSVQQAEDLWEAIQASRESSESTQLSILKL